MQNVKIPASTARFILESGLDPFFKENWVNASFDLEEQLRSALRYRSGHWFSVLVDYNQIRQIIVQSKRACDAGRISESVHRNFLMRLKS